MAFLGKEYTLQKDENFDGFLKAAGVSDDEIAKLTSFKPVSKLEKDGDTYISTTITPVKTKVVKFQPGVETDEELKEGFVVKSVYKVEGNVVTQVVTHEGKVTTFKKEYNGDNLKVTITSNFWDGVAVRHYSA